MPALCQESRYGTYRKRFPPVTYNIFDDNSTTKSQPRKLGWFIFFAIRKESPQVRTDNNVAAKRLHHLAAYDDFSTTSAPGGQVQPYADALRSHHTSHRIHHIHHLFLGTSYILKTCIQDIQI